MFRKHSNLNDYFIIDDYPPVPPAVGAKLSQYNSNDCRPEEVKRTDVLTFSRPDCVILLYSYTGQYKVAELL